MAVDPNDPLTWELSNPATGAPAQQKPDPKNPLTWEFSRPSAPSLFPEEAIPQEKEPGIIGGLEKGLVHGLAYQLPQQLSQSVEALSAPFLHEEAVSPAHAISQWADEKLKAGHPEPYKNWLAEQAYQTGAMMAPSVIPGAALGLLGLPAAAAIVPAALFGLSQKQQTIESAKERMAELQNQETNLIRQGAPYGEITKVRDQMEELKGNKEIASVITGAIETFGETLGTIYLSKLFGPLAPMFTKTGTTSVQSITRPTLRRFLRELPKTIGVEAGTEVFQNWTEAQAEKSLGVRPEAVPWEEGVQAIAPTIGMTLLTGGLAHPIERLRGRHLEKALTQPTTVQNIQGKVEAINEIAAHISEADEDIAKDWRNRAIQTVLDGKAIPLDQDIRDFAKGLEPTQGRGTAVPEEEAAKPEDREKPFDMAKGKAAPAEEDFTQGMKDLKDALSITPEIRRFGAKPFAPVFPIEPEKVAKAMQALDLTQPEGQREAAVPEEPEEIKAAGTGKEKATTAAVPEGKIPVKFIGMQETDEPGEEDFPMVNLPGGSTVKFNPETHEITNREDYDKAVKEQKPKEPLREERNKIEVKPGVTLRNIAEDLMSGDAKKEDAAIADLVAAVKSGKISKEDAMNTRNEIMGIAHEEWVKAGANEANYREFYARVNEPGKKLAAAESQMVEPKEAKGETKTAVPETEKVSRETIMKDLEAGRITPTEAAAKLGVEVAELKKLVGKEIKDLKKAGTGRPTPPKDVLPEKKEAPKEEKIPPQKLEGEDLAKWIEAEKRPNYPKADLVGLIKQPDQQNREHLLGNVKRYLADHKETYEEYQEKVGKLPELQGIIDEYEVAQKVYDQIKAWDKAFSDRVKHISPTGKVISLEFKEGDTTIRELVGKSGPDQATNKLRVKVREKFPELAPLPEKEKPKEIKKAGAGPEKAKEEKPEEPAPTGNRWTRNKETGKIELYFSKADFNKLDDKLKQRIKVRFLWAPSKQAWVSKATKDMFWPDVIVRELTKLGIFEGKVEEEPGKAAARVATEADIEAEVEKLTEEDLDKMLDEAFEEKPDKAKEGMPTVEAEAARAYAPGIVTKPKPTELGLTSKSPTMRRAKVGEQKAWTNGNFLDLGQFPWKAEGKILTEEPDTTELWNDAIANDIHPLGDPWLSVAATHNHKMDIIVWGTPLSRHPLAIDLKYFSYFKTQYPDAEFFYGEDEGPGRDDYQREILVKSNGKPVGLVMPLRNTFLTYDDVRGFKPAGLKYVPPDGWETNLMKARMYASHLKIPHVARRLDVLVRDIKAKLAESAGQPVTPSEPKTGKPEDRKTLTEILKDVKDLGVKGVDEAMKGLYELFGGSALKSFPAGLDADTYAKAKPHFEAAFQAFKEAGHTLGEFFAEMRRQFGDTVKPYLRYFMQEKMGKKPEIEEGEQPDLSENTGKGERGARKQLTEAEKAEKEAKRIAAEEKKAKKAAMGEFQNVGYVYDPEKLNQKTKDKAPRTAGKIILDEMAPGKLWEIDFPEGATQGVRRVKDQMQGMFKTFREFLLYKAELRYAGGRRNASMEAKLESWMNKGQGSVETLKGYAKEYGETLQPFINAFKGQTNIAGAIGALQQVAYPGIGIKYTWPQSKDQISKELKPALLRDYQYVSAYLKHGSERYLFDFLKDGWKALLANENEILLSEIDINHRGKNKVIVRSGLPDYREGVELKKSEDFQQPFGFKGVGFGEEGWINQEERNRVIPAAFDAFKDLAATIKAPDRGMSLGGDLAVQFANLGHKAHGSAAAYFPDIKTINFTRDNGDGTMAHEWGHALHSLAAPPAIKEINSIIETLYHVYDFEAGKRLVDDLLGKNSPILKRIISSKKQQRIEAVKEKIRDEFEDIVKKETAYFQTAKVMNADYTARNQEMWARAWEAFIHDVLPGQNNYLVNDFVAAGRVGGSAGVGTMLVYPAGKEREQFNETIQHFVDGLEWDETGKPHLKADYETIEKFNKARLKEELEKLLATVEERYKAIWTSEPSKDGKYWYRYEATEFAPMMQPEGYVGYDKEYKGTEPTVQEGKGAVSYLTALHPDAIMDFKLSNIQYEGENPTYISQEEGGKADVGVQGHGQTALGEEPAEHGKGAEGEGGVRQEPGPGGIAGVGGARAPGAKGGAVPGGPGGRGQQLPASTPGNFRITDPTLNDPKSIDSRFILNLAAIRVLKDLETTGRPITPKDKEILSKYTGMGGFAEVFSYDPQKGWKERADLLKAEMTPEEIEAAAASSPSAYYTPIPVARFMWKLAERLGFKKGLVLEPSLGANGTFFGTLPEELDKSTSLQGIERDEISAKIAARLYEKANIENRAFQDANKPNNRAELVIGNVPFQNLTVTDTKHNKGSHTLANYFVNKSLNLAAPGTLVMLIVPTSTMDSTAHGHLKEYAEKADLVGAIRLPSGIYAGSDVVCDILVFRKKIQGSKFKGIEASVWTNAAKDLNLGVFLNRYFLEHPDMVAGKFEKITGRYGDEAYRVAPEGDLETNLARIAAAFPENIVEREATRVIKSLDDLIAAPGTVKEGGLYVNAKGQAARKAGGEEILFPMGTPGERRNAETAKSFVKLLDQVLTVLRVQKTETDKDLIKAAQQNLQKEYDSFVKKHGPVNRRQNAEIYNDATDSPWVLALEHYDPEKDKVVKLADIFTKEIIPSMAKPDHAETDHDALAMSLDEFGYPNPEYMAKLRSSDTETVLKGVQDKIVENPETGFLETMDEYLSGNVKRKLAVAREMAETNPQYQRNVKLLEAAQPPEIPAHRITARIGASWIHPNHLSGYVGEKMKLGKNLTALFSFSPVTNEWRMTFKGRETYRGEVKAQTERDIREAAKSVEATRVWGTPYRNFFLLMQDAIEGRRPVVSYYDPTDKKTHIDPIATKGAEAKLDDVQRDFARWLFAEPTRGREAAERFNEIVNTSVPMIPEGSHLTFPGKSLWMLTAKEMKNLGLTGVKEFYPHQVDAVWKYLRTGNLYLAHEMGAGKTVTMALIAMEARRLRGKKKVLYITHSDGTMDQGIAEIKNLYPLANVLPVRVSTNEERKQLALQKIALNDFDVAIMRQRDLDRIDLSPDAERVFIEEEIQELREVLEDLKKEGAKLQERDIQIRIDQLRERLKEKTHEEAKRKNLFFDDLGIDLLICDEAHTYKNVPYATRLSRITGLNPAGSVTARAFFRKTQYLNAQFPKGDAVVLGSGTPLTNSIAELYNIQRMLQPKEVKRLGVWNFDRWIANFGDIGGELEWDGARGEYKQIVTNKRIINAGRLLATVFQNVHSVKADDTPIKRPKIRGGEPQRVKVKPNQYVQDYKEIILQRCQNLEADPRHATFEGVPDNMLRIISNMSKVAIDQRLDKRYANAPMQQDGKIYQASRNIFKRWKEEAEHKGVQLVFADLGIPHRYAAQFKEKTDDQIAKLTPEETREYLQAKFEAENQAGAFNVYDGIKSELVKLGIPANQIAFIHDADSANKDKKKANLKALFNKVNNGDIRVLIGSTSKSGTGVNVQGRVSDVHHLDVWWHYAAWAQRNGRARRAGNLYTDLNVGTPKEGVYIWNYVTETTVDATRWDKVFAKGRVLNSVLNGDINLDVIEDISEETLSAKLMAAEASGDPLMAKHATTLNRVQNLRMEQSSYLDNVRSAKLELAGIPGRIAGYKNDIKRGEASRAMMDQVTALQFVGDDYTFVLEKDGKLISQALEKAVKEAIDEDPGGENNHNLLVLGTHEETETKQMVEGKEKKGKKVTFTPLPIQMTIPSWEKSSKYYHHIKLEISGKILSVERDLADIKKNKKGETTGLEVEANISRTVTEYVSQREREDKWYKEEIGKLEEKAPKLKEVVETPWEKQEEFETKLKELEEIERQMAERGTVGGRPESGMPMAAYEAPVPTLEDIADKNSWRHAFLSKAPYQFTAENQTVYWPSTRGGEPDFAFRAAVQLKDFARNRAGKFESDLASEYNRPDNLELFSGPPLAGTPKVEPIGFTTIDNKTRFWIPVGDRFFTVDPVQWQMLERIIESGMSAHGRAPLAPGAIGPGSWHFEGGRLGGEYFVHIDAKGQRDAFIRATREKAEDVPKRFAEESARQPVSPGDRGTGGPGTVLHVDKAPIFYSTLQRAIEAKMGGSMPVKQLQAFLKQPGIKRDELKWTGLDDFLAKKEGKVTKAEVLQFLKENQVEIQETMKGKTGAYVNLTGKQIGGLEKALLEIYPDGLIESTEGQAQPILNWIERAQEGDFEALSMLETNLDSELLKPFHEGEPLFHEGGRPKYEQYTLPGGENYRELLLTLPMMAERATGEPFQGRHWEEPNVLAHVRFNERIAETEKAFGSGMINQTTEEPVLFIEEIQSDWGQQLRRGAALDKLSQPQSVWELGQNVFGREMAAAMPLEVMDGGMLSVLHHDQVQRAVISLLPVDMMRDLPSQFSPQDLFRNPDVVWKDLSPDHRNAVAVGILDAMRKVGAGLRAKLLTAQETGGDKLLLPTLRASELSAREVVGMLAPDSLYHPLIPGGAADLAITGAGTKLPSPSKLTREKIERPSATRADFLNAPLSAGEGAKSGGERATGLHFEQAPTTIADLLNWHNEIISEAGAGGQVDYSATGRAPQMPFARSWPELTLRRMVRYASENGFDRIAWTTGAMQGERYNLPEPEGMRGFYDKIIPDYLNKFGKKWGAQVEDAQLSTGETVHSLPITEEMKDSALREGFPLFADRSAWTRENGRVVSHSTLNKLQEGADYDKAKVGDGAAAARVVKKLIKPEKISELKAALRGEKEVILAPVRMTEKGKINALPGAMAVYIAKLTGWQRDQSIYQVNEVNHTDKTALERLLSQPEFSGEIKKGAAYVILDDVVTTGSTLANLKGFIEAGGGRVKAIQTLGYAQFSTMLNPFPATLRELKQTYGKDLHNVLQFIYGGPANANQVTQSEAKTLINNRAEILERRRAYEDEKRAPGGREGGGRRVAQRLESARQTVRPSARQGQLTPATGRPADRLTGQQINSLSKLVQDMVGTVPVFKDVVGIDIRSPEMKRALKKHGYTTADIDKMIAQGDHLYYVHGTMRPVKVSENNWKATIEIATKGREFAAVQHTALHEAFEQARFFMLKDEERRILNRRFPGAGGEAANEVQAEAFAKWWKTENGEGLGAEILRIFAKIRSFFEAIGNYIHGLGYTSSEEIFEYLASGGVRRRLRMGQISTGRVARFQQIPVLAIDRKNLDALKSDHMAQRAEQDPGFMKMINRVRFGLIKITDPDLKLWERILSLPFWLQRKYHELRPLVRSQMNREEARSQKIHDLVKRAQDFFLLKGEQVPRVEKAIIAGDRGNKVFDENTLRKIFQLDTAGVKAYRAVRDTLDQIHHEWQDRIQENFLKDFEREKWFSLFKAAHDIELSPEETTALADALAKTHKAMELPLTTVKRHLQKIFREKLTQNDKRLLVKNYVEAWHKTRATLAEIKQIVKEAIGEDMSDAELEKNVRGLVTAYIRSEPQAQLLKELRSELNTIRGYFPRSQKMGKYFVRVSTMMEDPLGNQQMVTVFRKNAANRLEADKIYREVSADPRYAGMQKTVHPLKQEADNTFMGASAINMQRLIDNAINKLTALGAVDFDIAGDIRMNILETLADDLRARGAGRHMIRRADHVIEGYRTTELKEVLRDYIDGWAGMMTKQTAALEFLEELKDIPRGKKELFAYASKYAADMLRNQERMDRVSQKIRGSAFVYFLGASLRGAFVNLTQNYVTGIPFLAREVGWKSLRAEKLYHKAGFDVAMGGKNLTPVEQRMLTEMYDKGISMDQYIQQITRETKNAVSKRMGDIIELMATPFSWIERLNRKSAALAMFRVAYDKALAAKMNKEQAYRAAFAKAEDFVYQTHYLMSKANLPSVAAGGDVGSQFLKTAYTFRRFQHNYFLSMQNAFRGPDGKVALDVLGRSLAYLTILGGAPALPFLDDLMDLWERFFGTPVRASMRKTLRQMGGPIMEKMGAAGIPALLGIDLSGSLKTQLPYPLSQGTPSDTILGVYGGLLQKFVNAKDALQRNDVMRAIEFASPSFLESILKAYRLAETGATTPRGKILFDEQGKPIKLETGEAVTQAIGFRPQRLSEISGEQRTMKNVQTYFNDKKDDLYARWALAKTDEDRQRVVRDITKFNLDARKYPKAMIPPITMTSLRQALRHRQRPEKSFTAFGQMEGAEQ